ncbi:MAG: S-layer homology domain-containing protein [Selenomonadaceae bacterium]|nr:S-layer homology domain-containing protein [Selenomonadaceae bacterium]
MEKKILLSLIAVVIFQTNSIVFAAVNPFVDVEPSHWAFEAVTMMANKGIIEGYGDGTYRGNRNITRYEASTVLAKILKTKFNVDLDDAIVFPDIPAEHWAYNFVRFTSKIGITKGYEDNTFRGEKYITRYEMAQMLANVLNLNAETSSQNKNPNPFYDVSNNHWAVDAVTLLAAEGIIEGYGNGTFRGEQNITRYEAAVMIARATVAEKISN